MCTAITYTTKDSYFGRNLDLDFSYNETVTICPRTYPFSFKHKGENKDHYAMIVWQLWWPIIRFFMKL